MPATIYGLEAPCSSANLEDLPCTTAPSWTSPSGSRAGGFRQSGSHERETGRTGQDPQLVAGLDQLVDDLRADESRSRR